MLTYFINGQSPDISAIVREVIYAAIWIPYFSLSEQVRDTFTRCWNRPLENRQAEDGEPDREPENDAAYSS
ncbi:DUF2569 family protein [Mangrovibacterium diazotrophicum]|uniref:DUF2569 family protein n=1 Tax=Mangrovibacterium diazotrophicum TaxID=1261403 RepID=UPI000E74B581|nr:DUF2569 family protein [Mangrovibacterium diazotrophicum]